jgi:hypothetical protein
VLADYRISKGMRVLTVTATRRLAIVHSGRPALDSRDARNQAKAEARPAGALAVMALIRWEGDTRGMLVRVSRDEPLRVDHATGEAVLRRALEGKRATPHPHSTVIALSLHDDDPAFVEGWCVRLGRKAPDAGMRAVAALGISHLARRFGTMSPEAAELVRELARDKELRATHPQLVEAAARRLERSAR